MNWLDIVIAVPLVLGAYHGFKKGFIIELASLAALILGIFAAINFSYFIAGILSDNMKLADKYINIIAFIFTFILVVLTIYFLGKLLEKVIDILMLGIFNRIAGLLFGIFKWAFVLSVLIFIMNILDGKKTLVKEDVRNKSVLFNPIASFAPKIIPKLSIDKIEQFFDKKPGSQKEDLF